MSTESADRYLGANLLLAGSATAFAVMGADRALAFGPLLAILGLLVATAGALQLAGAFDPEDEDDARAIPFARVRGPLALGALAAASLILVLREAVAGALGVSAAFAVPIAFLAVVVAMHHLAVALGSVSTLASRRGFWVIAGATLLFLPLLGSTSLVDPWESHYGEVAREMIARDDWVSGWWAQDRWFFSKPVLDLWLEAFSMRALGVHAGAGAMLVPIAGAVPRPEWALRLPSFLFAVSGLYLLYRGVARSFGRRAGVLTALVLATMPQFFLMARQATTDMPLVGSLTAVLGLLLLALASKPRERATSAAVRIGSRVLQVNIAQIVLAGAVLIILPQILYLLSRNVTLHLGEWPSIELHADRFWSGSAGNCGLPGNAPCAREAPLHARFPPALQALGWSALLTAVLAWNRHERRTERIAYLGSFVLGAIAMMAKGPLGVVLPGSAFIAVLVVTGRPRRLARAPIATGTLLVLAATLPWYVAAFVRHGAPFTDELVFRHMIGRATSHLHDTNAGDDVSFHYYVWQLGYGLFGWAGLCPLALAWSPGPSPEGDPAVTRARHTARALAFLWAALTFALFTVMPTKFHHYIFPALPGVAVLIGISLDALLDRTARASATPAVGAAILGGAALVLLIARDLAAPGVVGVARLINLVTYNYGRPWPENVVASPAIAVAGVVLALSLGAAAVVRARRVAIASLGAASIAFAVWGLDVYLVRLAPHWGQRELITEYLRERTSDADPIAAFNVNWKGENFYTGNHIAVFPAGGKIQTWMASRRGTGAKAFFFLTEHSRLAALKGEVGAGVRFEPLTTKLDNNKIVLVRIAYDDT